jgi:two-component system chemotaxis sensor kinase CheA
MSHRRQIDGRRIFQAAAVLQGGEREQLLDEIPEPGGFRADVGEKSVATIGGKIFVEQFHREVDVILKPLEGLLAYADEFSGTALLGDGLVLLVLNMKEVLGLAARVA